jgi:glycine/D-amino acid oxidase-like deaminating enzyme
MRPELHPEFKGVPYWWEDAPPRSSVIRDHPPSKVDIAVIGGGYAGLSAALALRRGGADVVVLEQNDLGAGASTRNGGAVSGWVSLNRFASRNLASVTRTGELRIVLQEAAAALEHLEALLTREKIDCSYTRSGLFIGAHTPEHYAKLAARLDQLQKLAGVDGRMVSREDQDAEVNSTLYFGGLSVDAAGKLHPARFHEGLLTVCRNEGVRICARTAAQAIARRDSVFEISTRYSSISAENVVIATNGYTGNLVPSLRRRIIPVATQIVATEELPSYIIRTLIPGGRNVSDTRRLPYFYRIAPDSPRLLFGGRASGQELAPEEGAAILYRKMLEHFPQLRDFRVTHSWGGLVAFTFDFLPHLGEAKGLHYCLGCNGSGIAMMTYLGYRTAQKLLEPNSSECPFNGRDFPHVPFYTGHPWFLSTIGAWYSLRDNLEIERAQRNQTG